jgi:hypothetical protein
MYCLPNIFRQFLPRPVILKPRPYGHGIIELKAQSKTKGKGSEGKEREGEMGKRGNGDQRRWMRRSREAGRAETTKGRSGESVKQIKESREAEGRKKFKVSIGISEVLIRTHRISANKNPVICLPDLSLSLIADICYR